MYSLAVLSVRFLAAYLVLTGLAESGYVLTPLFENPNTYQSENYYFYSLWVLTNLVFGILTFFLARPFAGILTHALVEPKIAKKDIEVVTVGTFLIGLFFVGNYLPNAISSTFIFDNYNLLNEDAAAPRLLGAWLPVLVGAIIMIGTAPITKLFSKIRKM